MIICQCNVVSDEGVRAAVANGARSVSQICGATGAGKNCGSCVFSLKRLLCEHQRPDEISMLEVIEGAAS